MTKFFIATIIGCGLLVPTQAFAVKSTQQGVKKEIKKNVISKVAKKVDKKSKKSALKKVEKKAPKKVVRVDFEAPAAPVKKVVLLDFDTPVAPVKKVEAAKPVAVAKQKVAPKLNKVKKKVQIVKTKLPKKSRGLASVNNKPMSVAQLKANTKPYWGAYCKDGIVLNNHVYCAMKNPQRQALAKAKQTKMASSKNLEAKKHK